jgi:hypothetical protein
MGVSAVALAARCFLGLVFAVAAAGKLADRVRLRKALGEFGLPRRATVPGALMLPLAELVVAGLLIPPATARAGALSALGLLVLFCVAIGRTLARGERPDCNCFGQIRAAPIDRGTIARNVALAAVAGVVAATGTGEGRGGVGLAVTLLGVVAVAIAVVLGPALFRRKGRRAQRTHESGSRREPAGLLVGEPAPAFDLRDFYGRLRTLEELLARGLPLALVFSDPGCAGCASVPPVLHQLDDERGGSLEIALITRGGRAENQALVEGLRPDRVLLEQDGELSNPYRIGGVPSATIVDPDGRIASPTVTGVSAVEELLTAAATSARLRVAQR